MGWHTACNVDVGSDTREEPMAQQRSGSRGGAPAGEAGETVKQAARDATEAARDVAAQRADTMFQSNKQAAVSRIGGFANVLRSASSELDAQQLGLAELARRAADALERASQRLDSQDLRGLFESGQAYARQRPQVFLGGAFAAGFALARFLRSSASHAYGGYRPYGEGYGEGYGERPYDEAPYAGAETRYGYEGEAPYSRPGGPDVPPAI